MSRFFSLYMNSTVRSTALAVRSGRQQHRAHAGGHADTVGIHVAGQKLHGVVNGQAGGDGAAGRVDVDVDVFFGIVHLQEEELRYDGVGDVVIDRRSEKDDPVLQEARIDIVALLPPTGLFDDHRDGIVAVLGRGDAAVWLDDHKVLVGSRGSGPASNTDSGFLCHHRIRGELNRRRGPAEKMESKVTVHPRSPFLSGHRNPPAAAQRVTRVPPGPP
jgi:hypothetical protein